MIKKILSAVMTVLLTFCSIKNISYVVNNKIGLNKYETLIDIGDDIDVLFTGTSHVWDGVFPMEMWHDYGIAAYNAGYAANRIPMDYWIVREALLYSQPKLVVMDLYSLSEDFIAGTDSQLHTFLDGFPLSMTKIKAIMDLNTTKSGPTDKLDMIFNFCTYHSRWDELEAKDFQKIPVNNARGANRMMAINENPYEIEVLEKDIYTNQSNVSMIYLEKTIQYLQKEGIEVLLIYLPQPSTEEAQAYYNWGYKLAETYHINYLDMTRIDGLVDYDTDLGDFYTSDYRNRIAEVNGENIGKTVYDNNGHLNTSGANKVTSYLAQYIKEHYDIADHRGEEDYQYWDDAYEQWVSNGIFYMKQAVSFSTYLMLLADNNYDVAIEISNTDIFMDEFYVKLLENIGADLSDIHEDTDFIYIDGNGTSVKAENFFTNGIKIKTCLGILSYCEDSENKTYSVYLDDEEIYMEELGNKSDGVSIRVFRTGTDELVDQVSYSYELITHAQGDCELIVEKPLR